MIAAPQDKREELLFQVESLLKSEAENFQDEFNEISDLLSEICDILEDETSDINYAEIRWIERIKSLAINAKSNIKNIGKQSKFVTTLRAFRNYIDEKEISLKTEEDQFNEGKKEPEKEPPEEADNDENVPEVEKTDEEEQ